MEMMEDDLFFADLNKQISLLIMDEEDADVVALSPPWYSYPHQEDMSYIMGSTPSIQGLGQGQGQQPRNVQVDKSHQEGMREMSKGTGVFIPKFAQPRRKRTNTFTHPPSRHNSHSYNTNNNYSRPNYHHPQHLDFYTTRRSSRDESKASYFIQPDKI